jgi:hypothetical protein
MGPKPMHDGTPTADEDAPQGRALVAVPAPVRESRTAAPRPLASFVTQLFACETALESFRRRRRAGPDRANASYEGSEHLEIASPPRFERVL